MKMVLPIIGTAAIIVQLIRFWPFTFTTILTALVTGGVFYITCKLGWDIQKGRILQSGYKGWGDWGKRALLGTAVFMTLSLVLLFFSFNNPICEDAGAPFFGRCEKYIEESSGAEQSSTFNLGGKSFYPLFLAMAYFIGSAAMRVEHTKKMGQNDRRIRPRKY